MAQSQSHNKNFPVPARTAILVSGTGSILEEMIASKVPISLVVADKRCQALDIAAAAGIETVLLNRREFGYRKYIGEGWDREGYSRALSSVLIAYRIRLVAMAGFFTVLHEVFFKDFGGRTLNIHPSLLPDFPGEFAVRDALAAGVKETGSTVHIATAKVDDPTFVLAQVKVLVQEGDDVEGLWELIKIQERKLYPWLLHQILSDMVRLDQPSTYPGMVNPTILDSD